VLFAAVSRLCESFPKKQFKLALVGKPADLSLKQVQLLAARSRVLDKCTFFENIPPIEVANILNASRVHVLTSLYEGSPKVLTESLFSNVPVIVNYRLRGLHPRYINSQTGLFATDSDLAEKIVEVVENRSSYAPREWAEKNSGFRYATRELNSTLRQAATAKNLNWTSDIIPKRNSPHLRYIEDILVPETETEFERLKRYLR
jgi:glycosyltransferase involved in cell wall biosynthesis